MTTEIGNKSLGGREHRPVAAPAPSELSGVASVAEPKDGGDLQDFQTRYVSRAREIRGNYFAKRQALRELMAEARAERAERSDGRHWVLSGLWPRMIDAAGLS